MEVKDRHFFFWGKEKETLLILKSKVIALAVYIVVE